MANELVIVELLGNQGDPIEYTCLDANAIPKGSVLELEDLRTVKLVSAGNKPLAGVASMEKVASDGSTTISVFTNGIFKAVCAAGGATVGHQQVCDAAGNTLSDFDTLDNETGDVLGYAMETATAAETYLVRVLK